MARNFVNQEWNLPVAEGRIGNWEALNAAILMDIREELRTLNRLLGCSRFVAIPSKLDQIEANTRKPKRKKKL